MTKESEKKVLVVEDDLMSFKLIQAHMKRTDYEVLHARDGLSAVEIFAAEENIGAIIMDLQLPGMNGLEATKEIRKLNNAVPIIAATANVSADDRIASEEAGCTYHLTKPINFPALMGILKKHMD